jgi:4-cresol dehydrogenase (hydroxylating) flavoprotein subunit
VADTVSRIRNTMSAASFEDSISISTVTDRAVYITAAILYDLERPGDDELAQDCLRTLVEDGIRSGIYPARLVLGDLDTLPEPNDDHDRYLARLKSLADPAHVLAPGRYSRDGP